MGWVSPNALKHHLDRKRNRAYRPIEAYFNMEPHVQWKNKKECKATVHAISDDGIREVHFDEKDIAKFIEKFGPKLVLPEETAMAALVAMSDEKLLVFIGQVIAARAKKKK